MFKVSDMKRMDQENVLIVADKEEDGILADGLKRSVPASSLRKQVVHPVCREELARPGRETQPEMKTLMRSRTRGSQVPQPRDGCGVSWGT